MLSHMRIAADLSAARHLIRQSGKQLREIDAPELRQPYGAAAARWPVLGSPMNNEFFLPMAVGRMAPGVPSQSLLFGLFVWHRHPPRRSTGMQEPISVIRFGPAPCLFRHIHRFFVFFRFPASFPCLADICSTLRLQIMTLLIIHAARAQIVIFVGLPVLHLPSDGGCIRDFVEFNGNICLDSASCVPHP